jgi:tRNA G18 (ribose-2'-O)-methylase SpoU
MRLTARPVELEARLRHQQQRLRGVTRSPIPRLPLVVLVDNIRSLWNVGAIFRTADACGIGEVVLAGISGCPPRKEIAKTALGAEEVVAWRYRADAGEALREIVAEGYVPVAIETSDRAVPLHRIEWPDRVCLVLGNEVAGISPPVLSACSRHVAIPMRGLKDSLNVAVAFGIVAFRAAEALAPAWPPLQKS